MFSYSQNLANGGTHTFPVKDSFYILAAAGTCDFTILTAKQKKLGHIEGAPVKSYMQLPHDAAFIRLTANAAGDYAIVTGGNFRVF